MISLFSVLVSTSLPFWPFLIFPPFFTPPQVLLPFFTCNPTPAKTSTSTHPHPLTCYCFLVTNTLHTPRIHQQSTLFISHHQKHIITGMDYLSVCVCLCRCLLLCIQSIIVRLSSQQQQQEHHQPISLSSQCNCAISEATIGKR